MTAIPIVRPSFLTFIADHNPFYLLSAVFMLLGCLLVSNTMTWSPVELKTVLILILTLNIYELLLVALGLFLFVKRGLRRDGVILLSLEALFLVDVGFLNAEVYQLNLATGIWVNSLLLVVAIIKLAIIFRVLGVSLSSPWFSLLLLHMTALLAVPGILKYISAQSATISTQTLYIGWWLLALLIVASVAVTKRLPLRTSSPHPRTITGLLIAFITVALVSLAAHLGTSHWIYEVRWSGINLTQVLLAVCCIPMVYPRTCCATPKEALAIAAFLQFLVLAASKAAGHDHIIEIGKYTLTPLMLNGLFAYFIWTFTAFYAYAGWMIGVAIFGALVYVFGPSYQATLDWLTRVRNAFSTLAVRWTPSTQTGWGIVALAGAFITLTIGAVLSLKFGRPDDERQKTAPLPVPLPVPADSDTAPPASDA